MPVELKRTLVEDANRGAEMVLCDPVTWPRAKDELVDEQGNKASLYLLGTDSDAWKAAEDAENRLIAEAVKRDRKYSPTADESRAAVARKFAAVTTGWANCGFDGSEELTPERCVAFYIDQQWVIDQAAGFISDRRNFARPSKTN